jgi:tape measure domain-containing protein
MSRKSVSVRLVAEGGEKVRAEFKGVGDAGEREFGRVERSADATGAVMKRVFGILAAAVSVREIVSYADTWTDLRSRVDLATGSQEAGAQVMGRLSEMARRTYSSLELTAESYLANANSLRELGLSTAESLDFTEALNNALVVSGAKAERAASVQNALSKAMALGKLSGDDLNTVIQSGGRVAQLLAAELGVTVNQLRQLGSDGEITGDVIRSALVGNLELLREEADGMAATVGDAFVLLHNAAISLVGAWDQTVQASSMVAQGIILIADNLARLTTYAATAAAGFVVYRGALIAASIATGGLTISSVALRAALLRTGIGALVVAAGELVYQFLQLVEKAGGFGNALDLLKNVAVEVFDRIAMGFGLVPAAIEAGALKMKSFFIGALASMAASFVDFTADVADSLNALFNLGLEPLGGTMAGFLSDAADEAGASAEAASARFNELGDAVTAPLESIQALRDAVTEAGESTEDGAAAAERLAAALGDVGGTGGGAAGAAAKGLKAVSAAADELKKRTDAGAQAFSGMLSGIITGGRSAMDVLGDLLMKLAEVQIQNAVLGLANNGGMFGALFSALGGALTPGGAQSTGSGVIKFSGGGYTGSGARSGGMDGQGGFMAMLHPQETVVDHARGGTGGGMVTIRIEEAPGFAARVRAEAQGVAVQVVGSYDSQMPARVNQITNDPRAR